MVVLAAVDVGNFHNLQRIITTFENCVIYKIKPIKVVFKHGTVKTYQQVAVAVGVVAVGAVAVVVVAVVVVAAVAAAEVVAAAMPVVVAPVAVVAAVVAVLLCAFLHIVHKLSLGALMSMTLTEGA